MSSCLVPETEQQAATTLLACGVDSIVPIAGGRNSRVYRVLGSDGQAYALKAYFRHAAESRDRLKVEFTGLSFLWQHGIHNVPQPIAMDDQTGHALYTYIEGEKVPSEQISLSDIDAAVAFFGRLKELSAMPESATLPRAAEACFSIDEFVQNFKDRWDRLMRIPQDEPNGIALHAFLMNELWPALVKFLHQARSFTFCDQELLPQQRTLSPSDFGFHNALRQANGAWGFVDFEYFGWDDPAKIISDFLLHPAMNLASDLKQHFASRLLQLFAGDRQLADRFRCLYPLFGLKWCLILLNEFLSNDLNRRRFAASAQVNRQAVQAKQLRKSRRMLQKIIDHHE